MEDKSYSHGQALREKIFTPGPTQKGRKSSREQVPDKIFLSFYLEEIRKEHTNFYTVFFRLLWIEGPAKGLWDLCVSQHRLCCTASPGEFPHHDLYEQVVSHVRMFDQDQPVTSADGIRLLGNMDKL